VTLLRIEEVVQRLHVDHAEHLTVVERQLVIRAFVLLVRDVQRRQQEQDGDRGELEREPESPDDPHGGPRDETNDVGERVL
jgi:hypothetical protein